MVSAPDRVARRGSHLLAAVMALSAFVALLAWGLASPPGATPDEDFHMASIWCGWGPDGQHCADGDEAGARRVPRDLVDRSLCFTRHGSRSAACLGSDFGRDPTPDLSTTRGNFAHDYPPVFYAAMRTFVGDDVSTSVKRMRVANSLFAVLFLSLVLAALPRTLRRTVALATLIASVPFGIYLTASINPSGWAVLSASTLWATLLGTTRSEGRRRVVLAVLAVVSALIGCGARADTCLFSLLAVAVVVITTYRSGVWNRWFWAASIGSALVALLFFGLAHQSEAALTGFGPGASNLSATQRLWYNVIHLPALWTGSLGTFRLGWIDTLMPPAVAFGALGAWGAVVFRGWQSMTRRKAVGLLLVGAALVYYPLYLLSVSRLLSDVYIQPRYLLPMLVLFTGLSLLPARGAALELTRGQRGAVVVLLTVANGVALHTQVRRFVTGTDVVGFDLDRHREWWWNGSFSPMALWVVGLVAFGLLAHLVVRNFAQEVDSAERPG